VEVKGGIIFTFKLNIFAAYNSFESDVLQLSDIEVVGTDQLGVVSDCVVQSDAIWAYTSECLHGFGLIALRGRTLRDPDSTKRECKCGDMLQNREAWHLPRIHCQSRRLWLQPNLIIYGILKPLFAPEIALSRLN
jgi:hypothetical protein